MRIRMLELVRHDGVEFRKDEVREVDTEIGAYFCAQGWASDEDGNVETGQRVPGSRVLQPSTVVTVK